MEWSTEKRYLPYEKWSAKELLELQAQASNSPYQLHYHIRPKSGLMNDPNGFSYFNNEWHVFYQSYPFGPVHGLKSWAHCVSKDLVHWKDLGTAIYPDTALDSHGAYSGSAKVIGDKLFLMYTGNARDENWIRHPHQMGAFMDAANKIEKLPKSLIEQPKHTTDHFRDPQILEHNGKFYCIIGAQDKATKTGKISLFEAETVSGPWKDLGYVDFSKDDMGYMIECPNLVFIDEKPILIFCPQGMDKDVVNYRNIYPNMYLIGEKFDFETGKFTSNSQIKNLDEGFDVYATQPFNAPDGKVYALSWIGLPDLTYPTDAENWSGCYSQVKELSLKNGKLIQKPVPATTNLRGEAVEFTGEMTTKNQFELKLQIAAGQDAVLKIAANDENTECLKLHIDTKTGKLILDRKNSGLAVNEKYGTERAIAIAKNSAVDLDIFVDHSLIEVFVNGGENVLTGRFFPKGGSNKLVLDRDINFKAKYWEMADI
ncbi:sucrose-6-phosphate hydrolase [Lactobacillus psittaci]|uniref:Sucrose-6-phosphate hydrolase n=1 Tax=Lactobacillus psittaci DSM 15354 TaxID=1122152 RepID=A0A0R1S4R7_9LACO|nr:sucrose-6-phosphate hydrolase [Lactobacillus psittaci]KRL64007.1 sucrose-6-phosphate hydrolase [Lactobacillus psittaci DSM 15354]